jgi:NTP pyrophosphatase (non-canonical NTP hydrolase)
MTAFSVAPLEVQEKELVLPKGANLSDFQKYVSTLKKLRSFHTGPDHAYILLVKECGELGAVLRKTWLAPDDTSRQINHDVAMELADIFIYLIDLANQHSVSLEEAFREKEQINKRREWPSYYHST